MTNLANQKIRSLTAWTAENGLITRRSRVDRPEIQRAKPNRTRSGRVVGEEESTQLVRCPDKALSHPRPHFVRRVRQVGPSMMRLGRRGPRVPRALCERSFPSRIPTRGSAPWQRASGPTPSCSQPGAVEVCVDITQFVAVSPVRILTPLPFPETSRSRSR